MQRRSPTCCGRQFGWSMSWHFAELARLWNQVWLHSLLQLFPRLALHWIRFSAFLSSSLLWYEHRMKHAVANWIRCSFVLHQVRQDLPMKIGHFQRPLEVSAHCPGWGVLVEVLVPPTSRCLGGVEFVCWSWYLMLRRFSSVPRLGWKSMDSLNE